jgi:hypothetical protein
MYWLLNEHDHDFIRVQGFYNDMSFKKSGKLKGQHCYAEPVVVNHVELYWASGCESCCVILRKWLWIKLCYAEQVVVNHVLCWERVTNHGVLCWASGCESCCVILIQWKWIMVCYTEPVVVKHVVLYWASGCEWCCVMLSKWLCIMWYPDNHWLSITQHDSQPLAQHSKTWFITAGSV